MLDWQGELVEEKDRKQFVLADIELDEETKSTFVVSSLENETIDSNLEERGDLQLEIKGDELLHTLDHDLMAMHLSERAELGSFMANIGSTNVHKGSYVMED
eukprot:5800924-Ditylum_brightwellii.AAC.1